METPETSQLFNVATTSLIKILKSSGHKYCSCGIPDVAAHCSEIYILFSRNNLDYYE